MASLPSDGALDFDDRQQVEWEMDRLVRLVADHLAHQSAPPGWDEPRFLDWLARDVRPLAQSERATDNASLALPDARVGAVRDRIRARIASARLRVRLAKTEFVDRAAGVGGSVQATIEAAAAARCAPLLDLAVAAGSGRELWDVECDRWLELPEEVPRGRYVALKVAGDSMLPLLHPGDTVLVRLGPEVERDTVVVARRPDEGYVVKRVGGIGREAVELASLNPEFPSAYVPRDGGFVLGTVLMRWCAHPS